MSYCEAEVPQMTRAQHDEYIEKERKNFLETVGFVKANLSLDLERVFLGGLSKGGWTTSFVGEREMERLAGFIILLAGRQRGAVPGPQSMAGFPVYIGVGENDPNLIPGVQAAGFYRHCRADLCYEEFMGLGHQSPDKATRLVQWLEAYGPMSHPWLDAAAKERRKAEYREVYKKVLELKDQSAVCRELRSLLDDPRLLVACGEATVKAIVFQLATLARSDAQAAKALEAERMFYELVWKEWNMKTLEDSQELVDGYSRLAQAGSQTRYDVYAAKSYERLHPMYEAAKKQMGQMKEAQKKAQQKAPARPQMRNSSGTGAMSGF
jgi:hypothetical protein